MSRTMARLGRRGKRIPIACEPPPPVAVVGSLSAWINGDEGRKMLLEVGTFDEMLRAIVPLVGLQVE